MAHSHHNHAHHHPGGNAGQNERRLWLALGLTTTFMLIEVGAGWWTQSLALLSDAAHMFTDTAALAIALAATRLARRPADDRRSYGYYRFEILAAAFNALLLFAVALYILYEAWLRLQQPAEIHSSGMLWVAVAGLLVNLLSLRLLMAGQKDSLNVRGAYLEALSDLIGSVGVIVGALVLRFTGWTWVDSLVAVAIGLWVVPRTWTLLSESLHILLEGVPPHIDPVQVRAALLSVEGVTELHDLHIWALTSQKVTLTVHLVCPEALPQQVLEQATARMAAQFDIHHVVIQCEQYPCTRIHPESVHYLP